MNEREHSHSQSAHTPHGPSGAAPRGLHKDWRLWVVVAIMVGLVVYYLATLDFFH